MEEMNKHYVYRHLKPNGEVFYIGIGSIKKRHINSKNYTTRYDRAFSKHSRSKYWLDKVSKYTNYEVQILTTGLTKEEASEIETILINYYGRKDLGKGLLCNLTDGGGDGGTKCVYTEEMRKNRSERVKGIKNPRYGQVVTEETRSKISAANKGQIAHNKGKSMPESQRLRQSKVVLDITTGIFYNSVREAAQTYNLNYDYLKCMLNGNNKNKTNLQYA